MSLKIVHKNSSSSGTPPASGDIDVGELAINAADAELYTKDLNGNIHKFQNTTTGTASGVKFTQAGSGAVQRTVDSKLKDVVSVKDFGAVGDGVADDTAAVQAAFNSGATVVSDDNDIFFCSSTITVSSKSLHVIGGTFKFSSEDGITFTASSPQNALLLEDLNLIATSATSGNAIEAIWPEDTSFYANRGCRISNVYIGASDPANHWGTGIYLTNANRATISRARIDNPGTQFGTGIYMTGSSVHTLISDVYINNVFTGIFCTDRVHMVKIISSFLFKCLTCIDFFYLATGGGPGAGVLLSVVDTNLFPTFRGIKMRDVIIVSIRNVGFQKQFAGLGWKGIDIVTTTLDIQQAVIDGCNFGNQLAEVIPQPQDDWVGINIQSGITFQLTNNFFDSSSGRCIVLASGVKGTIITNNINAQEIVFADYVDRVQIIRDNLMLQEIVIPGSVGVDVGVQNPPAVPTSKYGAVSNGALNLYNPTGTATTISNFIKGICWEIINIKIVGANITFQNGNNLNLEGGVDFVTAVGNSITLQAWPNDTYGIVWRELSRSLTTQI
jgi:hypothetical protein